MTLKKGFVGLLSIACVILSTQASASANPFGNLGNVIDTVNDVNATIDTFDQAMNGSPHSILSLSQTLGLDSDAVGIIDAVESTQQVFQLYDIWTQQLSSSEQDTLSWLVAQSFDSENLTPNILTTSDWFLQKSGAEQSQAMSTFSQLQDMIEATGQDKSQFLSYAACLAGGGNCSQ